MKRLLAYAGFTAAVLGLAELTVQTNEQLFRAISHRVLTKAELLDRKPAQEIIFFGTSRTWDGVSVRLFAEELDAGDPPSTFNLATTGSSLETLEYLAERFAGREGLRLALIELTIPQLKREGRLAWEAPPLPEGAPLEEQLQTFARRHIKLIDLRSMFVGENFVRIIPLLFFADHLDGSEVNPRDFMRAWRGEITEQRLPAAEFESWRPHATLTSTPAAHRDATADAASALSGSGRGGESAEAERAMVERIAVVAKRFEARGVRVVFFVPPLRKDDAREERAPPMQHLYAEVARATNAPVLDFISAADAHEADSFRDTSHLNRRGRARFSQALARALLEARR